MPLPHNALALYETLRSAVIKGQPSVVGLAALRFHGMWGALLILASTTSVAAPARAIERPLVIDDQFVRLMANLVLRTHGELAHVY